MAAIVYEIYGNLIVPGEVGQPVKYDTMHRVSGTFQTREAAMIVIEEAKKSILNYDRYLIHKVTREATIVWERETEFHEEGRAAFHAGEPCENPYGKGDARGSQFVIGWFRARDEAKLDAGESRR